MEKPPKIEEPPKNEKIETLLKVGDKVKVLRSSGETELGWEVSGFNPKTGEVLVIRKEGKDTLQKTIPQIELYALNHPSGETRKFPISQWIALWNNTVDHGSRKITIREQDQDMMLAPEQATQYCLSQIKGREGHAGFGDKISDEEKKIMNSRHKALFEK